MNETRFLCCNLSLLILSFFALLLCVPLVLFVPERRFYFAYFNIFIVILMTIGVFQSFQANLVRMFIYSVSIWVFDIAFIALFSWEMVNGVTFPEFAYILYLITTFTVFTVLFSIVAFEIWRMEKATNDIEVTGDEALDDDKEGIELVELSVPIKPNL